MRSLSILVFLCVLSTAPGVSAAPILYTDRAAYQAAVNATLALESFEVAVAGASSGQADYTDFSVSETNGLNSLSSITALEPSAVTHGSFALGYTDNGNSLLNFFNFNDLFAFAFDITVVDGSDTTEITLSGDISHTTVLDKRVPAFFGLIDTSGSLTGLQIDTAGTPAVYVDYVEYARNDAGSIPLPGTLLLFLGAGLLAGRFRQPLKN